MLKRKSDELKILEKLVKKKQISLDLISIALPLLTKQKTTVKQRKQPPLQRYDW